MPGSLKLILKYCCFFVCVCVCVCVVPKIFVPHLSCMFYALQVRTAHLSMLPRGLKKSGSFAARLAAMGSRHCWPFFVKWALDGWIEMYVAATCFYAAQPAEKGHKLQECGVFCAPMSYVETKTSFLSSYNACHCVWYSWHGRFNHTCQNKRIVLVGDLLLPCRYKPGTSCMMQNVN